MRTKETKISADQAETEQSLSALNAGKSPAGADRLSRVKDWMSVHLGPDLEVRKRFVRRVAVIVGRTYAECGDAATLADDVALMMIRDLLLELDEGLIRRHKRARLSSLL